MYRIWRYFFSVDKKQQKLIGEFSYLLAAKSTTRSRTCANWNDIHMDFSVCCIAFELNWRRWRSSSFFIRVSSVFFFTFTWSRFSRSMVIFVYFCFFHFVFEINYIKCAYTYAYCILHVRMFIHSSPFSGLRQQWDLCSINTEHLFESDSD